MKAIRTVLLASVLVSSAAFASGASELEKARSPEVIAVIEASFRPSEDCMGIACRGPGLTRDLQATGFCSSGIQGYAGGGKYDRRTRTLQYESLGVYCGDYKYVYLLIPAPELKVVGITSCRAEQECEVSFGSSDRSGSRAGVSDVVQKNVSIALGSAASGESLEVGPAR